MDDKARESQVRRKLQKDGFILNKSRIRNTTLDDHGGYRIVNAYTNGVEAGERFDLDLDDVEKFANGIDWMKI